MSNPIQTYNPIPRRKWTSKSIFTYRIQSKHTILFPGENGQSSKSIYRNWFPWMLFRIEIYHIKKKQRERYLSTLRGLMSFLGSRLFGLMSFLGSRFWRHLQPWSWRSFFFFLSWADKNWSHTQKKGSWEENK